MPEQLKCAAQKQCGACQLLAVPYAEQLAKKQRAMAELFEDVAGQGTIMNPIAGMDEPYYYRNKVTSPYVPGKKLGGRGNEGKAGRSGGKDAHGGKGKQRGKAVAKGAKPAREILCGMYAAGTHRVIATDNCLIENKQAKRVVLAIRSLMQRYGMEPYNEDAGTGFVRHVVVRVGHSSGEMLVTIVTNGKEFTGSRNFCRELVKRCPYVTTIVQNVNTRQTNVILGNEEKTLYGPGFIIDELCGLSFRISSHSFYQVNAVQTEVLYRLAIQMAEFTGSETALDAYCGTGTIGLVAAKGLPEVPDAHAAHVIGVDNVASAIKDAHMSAQHNGVENAEFETGDAGAFMMRQAKAGQQLDVLFMDPPRAGASKEFLEATCSLSPKRIVYISCNPETQERDVAYLVGHGYTLDTIQPVDMFPHTEHTECICRLTRA
jgi:23S rRNA (uracil1939-C5)-methyltransferase